MIKAASMNGYESKNDLELFHLVQQGDERAFTHIYNKYAHVLYLFAACYLKREADAEDAVQHVFMHLWEYRGKTSITVNLKNFLYTSVKNYVLNFIRNRQAALVKNYEIYDRGRSFHDSLEEDLEKKEINDLLEQAIADIRHRKKQQIVRFRREGFSNKEIAILLSIPENTVKTYYAQNVKLLKDHFKKILAALVLWCCN